MIEILVHVHVNVCPYVEYNCEYCVSVGVLTLTVCVIVTTEVYKRRIDNDKINRMMNNLVDILSFWSWCSSVEGGIDGNKLKFCRKNVVFCHNSEGYLRIFATKIRHEKWWDY